MREKSKLVLLLIVVFITVLFGFFLINFLPYSGDLIVENYTVEIKTDGSLTETYNYNVKNSNQYRMLYRYWDERVVYNENLSNPHIRLKDVYCNYNSYVKDYRGNGKIINGDSNLEYYVESKAYKNEIGCYNPNYFSKGNYELKIEYEIYPNVEYDDNFFHINLRLADEHIPYQNIRIIIDDPDDDITYLFTHPHMYTEKENGKYIITGSSPKDSLIEIEFVSKNIDYGYKNYEENVLEKTINANDDYDSKYNIFSFLNVILLVLTFGFALILFLIYYILGREKDYVVPEYLNFIPKKRKPWIVNQVFYKNEHTIDDNALYATLLDFHNRKIINMNEKDGDLIIEILKKTEKLDEYEQKAFSFIKKWGKNNIFNLGKFASKIKNKDYDFHELNEIYGDMQYLRKTAKSRTAKDFFINGKIYPSIFLCLGFILFIVSLYFFMNYVDIYPILYQNLILSIVFLIQTIISIIPSPVFFGHWKNDFYKEKLEWDSFKDFLSDMAQLKKYDMQDIIIWEEWLVYGTALGVGKKVAKSLKELKINIPQARYVPVMYGSFTTVNYAIMSTRSSSGGGGYSGGSFGGGGGFGGGGAGGR